MPKQIAHEILKGQNDIAIFAKQLYPTLQLCGGAPTIPPDTHE